jgi:hypothetical protein
LCGLRGARVDFGRRRLEVATVGYDAGRFGRGYKPRPKSTPGIRSIPLAAPVVEELRRRRPAERSSLLFPDASRYRLRHAYLRAVRRAKTHGHLLGLDLRGPHDLRHTFATWLEDDGIPARVIDELMGHAATRRSSWVTEGMSAMGAVYRHTTMRWRRASSSFSTRGWPRRSRWSRPRADGTTDGTRAASPLLGTAEIDRFPCSWPTRPPGDPLARGLPSPVCTARAGRQSRRQQTVTDRGECPAQRQYAGWFASTNVHRLLAAFYTLTRVVCCPSAAFHWVAC